ncbi:hypothetical protein OMW55_01220 [Sphingomonas sp. BN140010]|uniref:Uncharacterized protein n=1 Tax=Sphingomonas arvum TaxID=2992113 RepID=A0ABT3JBI5_9SPHN|nr:hypothetical protein [Sphingomonas sp. BN140010]MCW3796431.1 hypothetical protein [Sphingomonas sp. BN140010]
MSGLRRLILSLLLGAAASAAAAQSVVAPPPPSRPDTVGPEQLRDFSLGGNRQQQAEQPAATAPTRPAPATTATLPPATREQATARGSVPVARPTTQRPQPRPAPAETRPADSVTVGLPRSTPDDSAGGPTRRATSGLPTFGFPSAAPTPAPVSTLPAPLPSASTVTPVEAEESGGLIGSLLPLLALLVALGGGLLWWLRRNRDGADEESFGQLAFAGAPSPVPAPGSRPAPAPPVSAPQPTGQPAAKPASVGVVSSRLRAWLDIDIGVRVAAMTEAELQLEIDILLTNSGSAPAREIAVEALLLNAGPEQDADIARFFARPDPPEQSPDVVPPLGQLALSATLRMPRTSFVEYAAGNGKVMVPVVALSAGYRAGSSRGRTSAAFLIGRGEADAERLGPLPTDQGAKGYTRLAARRLPGGDRR